MYKILLYFFKKNSYLRKHRSNIKALILFGGLFLYSSLGFLYFEQKLNPELNYSDAAWWTVVTMTTVGYGDYFPKTNSGRFLVGFPTMLFGIGFLGFIISELASRLIEAQSRRLKGMQKVKCKDHILVINYINDEIIISLIDELNSDVSTKHKEIVLIDETLEEIPLKLRKYGVMFVRGNPTNEEILDSANMKRASHAVILSKDRNNPHSDDQNLATVLVIEKLHPQIHTVAEIIDPKKIKQLKLSGCDSVVCTSELTTNLIVQEIQDPGIKDIIFEITSNQYGHQIYMLPIKAMKNYVYRELANWCLESSLTIIGLFRDGHTMMNCPIDESILKDDIAIVIGNKRLNHIDTSS